LLSHWKFVFLAALFADPMVSCTDGAFHIPASQQHCFINHAKEFNWEEVQRQIRANPMLVNVQPCGREGIKRWSALHQAAFSGNDGAVRFLLDHKADLEATTSDGRTPLDVAKNESVKAAMLISTTHMKPRQVPTPLRKGTLCSTGSKAPKMITPPACKRSVTMKKAKEVLKIAKGKRAKALVYKGTRVKTVGGLTKEHLTRNKSGKIVSLNMHNRGKNSYANIKSWIAAFVQARSELQLVGFVPIKRGSPLYLKTMEFYKAGTRL